MNNIEKELPVGELIPVLLGASPEATQTARRLFRQYGRISRLFCDKPPFASLFTPCMKVHQVKGGGDRLMLTALQDFAQTARHIDVILYLIPCTLDYSNFVWRNRDALEQDYVIAGQTVMDEVWFGKEKEEIE